MKSKINKLDELINYQIEISDKSKIKLVASINRYVHEETYKAFKFAREPGDFDTSSQHPPDGFIDYIKTRGVLKAKTI